MAGGFPEGWYVLQHEDGRDIILPDGLNTTNIVEGTTVKYAAIPDSFGFKGYPARVIKSGAGTRIERTEANLNTLRTIVGMIEAALNIQVRVLNINALYEINEI